MFLNIQHGFLPLGLAALLLGACGRTGESASATPDLCAVAPQPAEAPAEATALIEVPLGGRVKYEFDPVTNRLKVDRILPDGFAYPAHYGAFPCTMAGDENPLDVLVVTNEALLPATLIRVRPVALLRMRDSGRMDDKVITVPAGSADSSVSVELRHALERFFSSYKPGGNVVVGAWEGSAEARAVLQSALVGPKK